MDGFDTYIYLWGAGACPKSWCDHLEECILCQDRHIWEKVLGDGALTLAKSMLWLMDVVSLWMRCPTPRWAVSIFCYGGLKRGQLNQCLLAQIVSNCLRLISDQPYKLLKEVAGKWSEC